MNISKILIVVGVSVVVIAGGIFVWQYLEKQKEEQKTSAVAQDATADWQTYRNEEYGFEVKYPQDWAVREGEFYNPSCDENYRSGIECSVQFTVKQNPTLLSVDKWVESETFNLNYFPRNKKSTSIGGVDGIKADITLVHTLSGTGVILGRGGLVYEFIAGDSQILEEILSTFRFVEK